MRLAKRLACGKVAALDPLLSASSSGALPLPTFQGLAVKSDGRRCKAFASGRRTCVWVSWAGGSKCACRRKNSVARSALSPVEILTHRSGPAGSPRAVRVAAGEENALGGEGRSESSLQRDESTGEDEACGKGRK